MEKNKGSEPAYPIFLQEGLSSNSHVDAGTTKREKLAMEIYVMAIAEDGYGTTADAQLSGHAKESLRAADIFFEQLNK